MITVEEMWKSWQYSQVFNWTIEEVVTWVNEQVKLPQYAEYFRRNRIDGQFIPRLAINENHYYSNVMQIKDSRHKRILMIKATDLVLFGPIQKPHNFVKDFFLVGALTLSIIFSLFLYGKHRQSLDRIRRMMSEVEKLGSSEENETLINQLKNNLKNDDTFSNLNKSNNQSSVSLFSIRKRSIFSSSKANPLCKTLDNNYESESKNNINLKENKIIIEKNQRLAEELNQAKVSFLKRIFKNFEILKI